MPSRSWIWILGIGALLLLLLAAAVAFSGGTEGDVVLNEVHFPGGDEPLWVELQNAGSTPRHLGGWILEGPAGRWVLPNRTLPPGRFVVVTDDPEGLRRAYPDFVGRLWKAEGQLVLSPEAGYLILREPDGGVRDALNWGPVAPAWAGLGLWTDLRGALAEGVRPGLSLERRVAGLDRDLPADWILQPNPSPGRVLPPAQSPDEYVLLTTSTNWAANLGGLLLSLAFVFIALVARRFELLFGQRTFWPLMLVSPVGILFYVTVQARAFQVRGRMTYGEQWMSFSVLLASAAVSAWVTLRFYRLARALEEEE